MTTGTGSTHRSTSRTAGGPTDRWGGGHTAADDRRSGLLRAAA
ncbi:hypothetical protein [Micromonospora mangrovi]|uniref:Uncharacterized protein n=1 Tax=Micromonospora sp. CCTCC AA 2012012 TaxID=3111921 RepID=A0AAU7MER8_9ACTN